jgi:ABC-2 type transport system ATP-binding protein
MESGMTNKDSLIRLDDVWKSYGELTAVAGLSFELLPGRILGLLGQNGAGKTTTIRMILNILKPDKGSIAVLGKSVTGEVKQRIGYLPEERGLYKKMKVGELLLFFGKLKGLSTAQARAEGEKWLERLSLADRKLSAVEDLSKGNQQKVQFIATIMHRPPLLILDEPFSGLDPVNARTFYDIIDELRRDGAGVIFSTHVLEQAERVLDDVIMLKAGQAVVQGTLDEVKAAHGSGWIEVRGEGAEAVLDDHPGVELKRPAGRAMRWRLKPGTQPGQILALLLERGVAVKKFEQLEASLNDIFLSRIGGLEVDTVTIGEESA